MIEGNYFLDAWKQKIYVVKDGILQEVFHCVGNLNGAYTPTAGLFAGSSPTTYTDALNRMTALANSLDGGKQA